jgi:serine/threonine protein kinase
MPLNIEVRGEHYAIPDLLGPYRIQSLLGRGGMGVVCSGHHRETLAPVAVKTLLKVQDPLLAGIRREIHALQNLEHPGLVRIVGHGVDGGVPWYAMDLLVGRTLRDQIRESHSGVVVGESAAGSGGTAGDTGTAACSAPRGKQQTHVRSRVARIGADWQGLMGVIYRACDALAHLHANGVVHRDLTGKD